MQKIQKEHVLQLACYMYLLEISLRETPSAIEQKLGIKMPADLKQRWRETDPWDANEKEESSRL